MGANALGFCLKWKSDGLRLFWRYVEVFRAFLNLMNCLSIKAETDKDNSM